MKEVLPGNAFDEQLTKADEPHGISSCFFTLIMRITGRDDFFTNRRKGNRNVFSEKRWAGSLKKSLTEVRGIIYFG